MSNFKCQYCGMTNIDCGESGYKTPRELELEALVKDLENKNSTITYLFELARRMKLKTEKQVYELVDENKRLKDTLKATTCQAECFKHKEAEHYKQALDDIEEICRQLLDDDYIRSVAESLIDIINKAKDGNNANN